MSFVSPLFYLFVLTTVLAFHAVQGLRWRQGVLAVANLALIASYAASWVQLLPLAGFLLASYGVVVAAARRQGRLAISLCAIVLLYVYLKQVLFLHSVSLPFAYTVIGLSYILFRVVHLAVDCSTGDIETPPTPLAFFLYTCNFLCFVSGPIQTWQEYKEDESSLTAPVTQGGVFDAISRIVTGLVKLAVVAATADYIFGNISVQFLSANAGGSGAADIGRYIVSAASYTAYLYYNFSGYMDIVIGIGALLGQRLPENFNRPFSAPSFLEFWQRWHITLSRWFKAYVFTPLMIQMVRLVPMAGATPYVGVVAFFATFLLMGVWHGSTSIFVVYGLLMGLGASVNKLWQVSLQKRLGTKRYKAVRERPLVVILCRGLTFAYFTMALTCLWVGDLAALGTLTVRLGPGGIVASLLVLTIGFAAAAALLDGVRGAARLPQWRVPRLAPVADLMLASRILLVVFVVFLLDKSPEFVYKAF